MPVKEDVRALISRREVVLHKKPAMANRNTETYFSNEELDMNHAVVDKICTEVLSYKQPIMLVKNMGTTATDIISMKSGCWTTQDTFPHPKHESVGGTFMSEGFDKRTLFQNELIKTQIEHENIKPKYSTRPPSRQHCQLLSLTNNLKSIQMYKMLSLQKDSIRPRSQWKRRASVNANCNMSSHKGSFLLGFKSLISVPKSETKNSSSNNGSTINSVSRIAEGLQTHKRPPTARISFGNRDYVSLSAAKRIASQFSQKYSLKGNEKKVTLETLQRRMRSKRSKSLAVQEAITKSGFRLDS